MSRKSSDAVSGGDTRAQVTPPSVVRTTVPLVPLAHATVALTALTPRNRSVVPVACGVHAAWADARPTSPAAIMSPARMGRWDHAAETRPFTASLPGTI